MDARRTYSEIIDDTLYGRRMAVRGCFAHNVAARELDECRSDILPLIERTILEVVLASRAVPTTELPDGFHRLLMSYGRIGILQNEPSWLEFVFRLPDWAGAKLVFMLPKLLNMDGQEIVRTFQIERLRPFLGHLVTNPSSELRQAADYAIENIKWN